MDRLIVELEFGAVSSPLQAPVLIVETYHTVCARKLPMSTHTCSEQVCPGGVMHQGKARETVKK